MGAHAVLSPCNAFVPEDVRRMVLKPSQLHEWTHWLYDESEGQPAKQMIWTFDLRCIYTASALCDPQTFEFRKWWVVHRGEVLKTQQAFPCSSDNVQANVRKAYQGWGESRQLVDMRNDPVAEVYNLVGNVVIG